MAEGFFGRWSQRKLADGQGKSIDERVPGSNAGTDRPGSKAEKPVAAPVAAPQRSPANASEDVRTDTQTATVPAPTMQDVAALHKDSDFKPFVSRAVQPEVRNAALKKMFSDPHFNVMDGLDTYIDDYSKPDPLPVAMLRQMASARFLKLFDEDDEDDGKQQRDAGPTDAPATTKQPREDADTGAVDVVAQSSPAIDTSAGATPKPEDSPTGSHNDDTDLRLQPDDAAGPAWPGRSTE